MSGWRLADTAWIMSGTRLGSILLTAAGDRLAGVCIGAPDQVGGALRIERTGVLGAAEVQLAEYLAGERTQFDIPLAPRGSKFQHRVWGALRNVPYGETTTYRELGETIGWPRAARAVGRANASNPWPIILPCHRVVGASGDLTGYRAGLSVKRWLLAHERALAA